MSLDLYPIVVAIAGMQKGPVLSSEAGGGQVGLAIFKFTGLSTTYY